MDSSEVRSQEVRPQLERILASQLFLHSRRYPALLRYVVEQVLDGHADDLKERTLGIAVFGRDPAYDTSADPVVRTTASEVRKRLDEYYADPIHAAEWRIALPVGSYVPVFRAALVQAIPVQPIVPEARPLFGGKLRRVLVLAAASLTVVAAALALTLHEFGQDPLYQFWEPALKSPSPVLVVVETLMGVPKVRTAGGPVTEMIDPKLYLVINDSNSRLAAYFSKHDASLQYELARNMTLARLRPHPFVLRGAFNNPLTRQSVSSLRYYLNLKLGDTVVRQIVDHRDPARHWDAPMGALTKDYALIARAPEPRTGQTMFVIAGLGERGGAAATEFLTNPKYMQRFADSAPKGWESRNLEIVVESDLTNDDWGEPHVVASEVW